MRLTNPVIIRNWSIDRDIGKDIGKPMKNRRRIRDRHPHTANGRLSEDGIHIDHGACFEVETNTYPKLDLQDDYRIERLASPCLSVPLPSSLSGILTL